MENIITEVRFLPVSMVQRIYKNVWVIFCFNLFYSFHYCLAFGILSFHTVRTDAKKAWKGHQYGSKGSIFEINFLLFYLTFLFQSERWWHVNPNQRREPNLNKKRGARYKKGILNSNKQTSNTECSDLPNTVIIIKIALLFWT